jgi:hypothetical protein
MNENGCTDHGSLPGPKDFGTLKFTLGYDQYYGMGFFPESSEQESPAFNVVFLIKFQRVWWKPWTWWQRKKEFCLEKGSFTVLPDYHKEQPE